MKRTLYTVALFLGFSAAGFSQTEGKIAILEEEVTAQKLVMIIDNPNVTIVPGQEIFINNSGVATLGSGEIVGQLGVGVVSMQKAIVTHIPDEAERHGFHGVGGATHGQKDR